MTNKITNRWIVVFGAILAQMSIGAIYTWSLFNQPLMDKYGWEKSEVVLTFSIAIFVFAASTILSGKLQDKYGPRVVATIGGLLYGGGIILSSFASSPIFLYISYGVIAGAGVGFVYVCPLSTLVKWFPDKKGFITGLAVGAFGAGSLVFKSVITKFLAEFGVQSTFLYLGLIYLILIVGGAQLLALPDSNSNAQATSASVGNNYSRKEMINTKSFYLVWLTYLFGCMSGLLVIGLAKDIGIEMANLKPEVAANAVAIIALFNASGRLIWGTVSDKIGRIKVVFLMFIITAVSMFVLSFVQLSYISFFASLSAIAFCFGGFLAVYPVITGDFFGVKNLGSNYGYVYLAYGVAALAGPIVVAKAGGFKETFLIAAIISVIGAVLTFFTKAPQEKLS